jgi:Fic family protein
MSEIDQAKGRQMAYSRQFPEQLKELQDIARVQSTEASNAIEGIVAPKRRIEAIVAEKATPRNRPEEEIAGYRKVLDLIHSTNPGHIPFSENVLKQFHQEMLSFTATPGGAYKNVDNVVEEELPDGTKRVRFRPPPAWKTADEMRQLHEAYDQAQRSDRFHPLLLIGAYVLDFLVIHPFRDGNGRMSRLLTLLLLYQSDYEVGRFVSIEKIFAESKETYYEALASSTDGWDGDGNDPYPWLRYFLGTMIAAYRTLEERVAMLGGRGTKTPAIENAIRKNIHDEFAIEDLRRSCPMASDDLIRKVIARLRKRGVLETVSRGRDARYRRRTTDF